MIDQVPTQGGLKNPRLFVAVFLLLMLLGLAKLAARLNQDHHLLPGILPILVLVPAVLIAFGVYLLRQPVDPGRRQSFFRAMVIGGTIVWIANLMVL